MASGGLHRTVCLPKIASLCFFLLLFFSKKKIKKFEDLKAKKEIENGVCFVLNPKATTFGVLRVAISKAICP